MRNIEKVNKFNKNLSDKNTSDKHFLDRGLENAKHDEHGRSFNSHSGKAINFYENAKKAMQNVTEAEKAFAQLEITSTNETNATEMNSNSADYEMGDWQQVKPKGRRKIKSNTKISRDIKTNSNKNLPGQLKQERLKSSEQRTVQFNENNSPKRIFNIASSLKATFFTSSNNYPNGIAITNKNIIKCTSNVHQSAHDKLCKYDEKCISDKNEKLAKILNSTKSAKAAKQKKKFGDLNSETSMTHEAVNFNCEFKTTGAIPKRSQYTQTNEQGEDNTLDFLKSEENQNMYKTKVCELKQKKAQVLKYEQLNLEGRIVSKPSEKRLDQLIDQMQLNESIEIIPPNLKQCFQIEDMSNFKEEIHQNSKINLNIERPDVNDVHKKNACCFDLTKKSETLERNIKILDDTSSASCVCQHNDSSCVLRNENEAIERNTESWNDTIKDTDNPVPCPYLHLPYGPSYTLPLQPYTSNYMFQSEFENYLSSEIPGQHFDNGATLDMNRGRYSNATSYDCMQSNTESTVEQESENVTNASQINLNISSFPNAELNSVQYEKFVVEHIYNGETYYQEMHFTPMVLLYCPFSSRC